VTTSTLSRPVELPRPALHFLQRTCKLKLTPARQTRLPLVVASLTSGHRQEAAGREACTKGEGEARQGLSCGFRPLPDFPNARTPLSSTGQHKSKVDSKMKRSVIMQHFPDHAESAKSSSTFSCWFQACCRAMSGGELKDMTRWLGEQEEASKAHMLYSKFLSRHVEY
jgi:hypothetical protein